MDKAGLIRHLNTLRCVFILEPFFRGAAGETRMRGKAAVIFGGNLPK
jgi:hypothetical protein